MCIPETQNSVVVKQTSLAVKGNTLFLLFIYYFPSTSRLEQSLFLCLILGGVWFVSALVLMLESIAVSFPFYYCFSSISKPEMYCLHFDLCPDSFCFPFDYFCDPLIDQVYVVSFPCICNFSKLPVMISYFITLKSEALL